MLLLLLLACPSPSTDGEADSGADSGGADSGADNGGDSGGGDSGTGDSGGDSGDSGTGDSGGGDSGDSGAHESCSPWFPFDVEGARWVFNSGASEVRAYARGPVAFGDEETYKVYIESSGSQLSLYFVCTAEGLAIAAYALGVEAATGTLVTWDPPVLYTPRDLTADLSWQTASVMTVVQSGRSSSQNVTARGYGRGASTVTVPAGTFDTIRIALDIGLGSTMDQYLTYGVGEVQGSVGTLYEYEVP